MTPAEHIKAAEAYIKDADRYVGDGLDAEANRDVQFAIAHALIAAAVELGVPHTPTTTTGA